ncbi:MAG TPA: hypothetical protein VLI54_03105 [Bacillota bacterium]|nr:hypothetical protein [Bacillota bacterium]
MTDRTTTLPEYPLEVECVICRLMVPLEIVTAGSLYADGRQAFACNSHIRERLRWTLAWLHFDADQHDQRSAGVEDGAQ